MERQHVVFIVAAAAVFGALLIVGLFFNPLKSGNSVAGNNNEVIKASIGKKVDIRYSSNVVGVIQKLPSKNNLTLEVSSQLYNTNLAGLRGEIRYSGEIITFVQDGKKETVTGDEFKSIQYRFSPDKGNMTTFTYENVKFTPTGEDSQLVTSFTPLPSAKVGDKYTVKLTLDTGSIINYGFGEKTIEIVP